MLFPSPFPLCLFLEQENPLKTFLLQKTGCRGILQWEHGASEMNSTDIPLEGGALHSKVLRDRRFRKREASIFTRRKESLETETLTSLLVLFAA